MAKKEVGKKAARGSIKEGLKNRSPYACDKSTTLKMTPTTDNAAVRTRTAPTPRTLGPRTA